MKAITLNANARLGQGAKIDCSNLTMIQVDIIQLDDYLADSCVISPTAFLLDLLLSKDNESVKVHGYTRFQIEFFNQTSGNLELQLVIELFFAKIARK